MEPEMYIHMPSETPEHLNVFGHMGGGWCVMRWPGNWEDV